MKTQSVSPSTPTGMVLNIQRYCSHDGPGIRTTVFLKGCSLALQMVRQSREHRPEAGTGLRPQIVHRQEGMRRVSEAPFPAGRLLRGRRWPR